MCILIATAYYVVQRVRGAYQDEPADADDWTSLSEMRDSGTLREYEYQHLRKTMAAKIADEKEVVAKPVADEPKNS